MALDLSVFGLDRRTNNCCESYHSQFNQLVDKAHPGFYDFALHVNDMFSNYHMEFDQLRTNILIPTVRERHGALEYRLAKLSDEERKLIILNTDTSFFIHASNKLYFHNHALKVFAIEISFFILKNGYIFL